MKQQDVYEQLTKKIIEKLEKGEIPWKKPWNTINLGYPQNFISKKVYKGINFWMTLFEERTMPFWLTFNQAKKLGGKIKKGSKATDIIFYQIIEKEDNKGKPYSFPIVKRSKVFNIEQCEDIDNPLEEKLETLHRDNFKDIQKCEDILKNIKDKISVISNDGVSKAFYRPSTDTIHMPVKSLFKTDEGYYATLFHEIGHCTGSKSRLERDGILKNTRHGDKLYAKEELVAELTSSFLCNYAGIENTVDNNAAYIQSWLNALNNDNKLVYDAMKDAFKAIEYLGILNEAA